jgi:hypothetical protein
VGGNEALDNLVNMINSRKHERFDRNAAAAASGSWDRAIVGRLLEVARRQGLIDTSFIVGPNGERTRMYQSWAYQEPEFDFQPVPEREQAPQEEPVSMATNENLPEREDEDDWF